MKSMKKMNRDIRSHFLRITEIQDEQILDWDFDSRDKIECKSLSPKILGSRGKKGNSNISILPKR